MVFLKSCLAEYPALKDLEITQDYHTIIMIFNNNNELALINSSTKERR